MPRVIAKNNSEYDIISGSSGTALATNESAGAVKGAEDTPENSGKITVDAEGGMSVVGWGDIGKDDYLPLTGGTVTGDTTFEKNVKLTEAATIRYNATDECIEFVFLS